MSLVKFVTEPVPELTLDRAGELNARFPEIMALDLPGIVLRQCGATVQELDELVKANVTDFDLRYLNFVPFEFKTELAGYGAGLHSDRDPSPIGGRRINDTFVEIGILDATLFTYAPAVKTDILANGGGTVRIPDGSRASDLYEEGLVDIDLLSPFAYHTVLHPGDGLVLADVNAHSFTHPSFPRISIAHLLEAAPKKRFTV